jgi:preprotein translocase subunit SecY
MPDRELILSLVAMVFVLYLVVISMRIAKVLGTKTTYFLVAAVVYAAFARLILLLNALEITDIKTDWTGVPIYILLSIGFTFLYFDILRVWNHKTLEERARNWIRWLTRGR